jgi:hypothetical protein
MEESAIERWVALNKKMTLTAQPPAPKGPRDLPQHDGGVGTGSAEEQKEHGGSIRTA